jgi:hypothetical protein
MNDHLFDLLREPFRVLLQDDHEYQQRFDRFEYMRSSLEVDIAGDVRTVGSYGWRWRIPGHDVRPDLAAEEAAAARHWAPYQAGWFNGQRDRFMAAKKKVDEFLPKLGWR